MSRELTKFQKAFANAMSRLIRTKFKEYDSIEAAAEESGISRTTLYRILQGSEHVTWEVYEKMHSWIGFEVTPVIESNEHIRLKICNQIEADLKIPQGASGSLMDWFLMTYKMLLDQQEAE